LGALFLAFEGKEFFHPVRIALTGSHSGPEFDKLIQLIEESTALNLGIYSVRNASKVL
jgi:glutamyl/glutaminyl-tRNA synthetase